MLGRKKKMDVKYLGNIDPALITPPVPPTPPVKPSSQETEDKDPISQELKDAGEEMKHMEEDEEEGNEEGSLEHPDPEDVVVDRQKYLDMEWVKFCRRHSKGLRIDVMHIAYMLDQREDMLDILEAQGPMGGYMPPSHNMGWFYWHAGNSVPARQFTYLKDMETSHPTGESPHLPRGSD